MRGHAQPAVEPAGIGRQLIAGAKMHDVAALENQHPLGESAAHPIEPRCGALAALLLLASMSAPGRPQREFRRAKHGVAR